MINEKSKSGAFRFDIITLFPEMFVGPFSESILKKAQLKDLISINFHALRGYTTDKHQTVDDTPYGGGKGMILKVDVMDRAIEDVKSKALAASKKPHVVLLSPKGTKLNQDKVRELAEKYDDLIMVCGHYEEFDERIREYLVDEDISIGDFILTGGELPAMMLVDSVSRMVPGVLSEGSAEDETFMKKDENGEFLKEHPQYTRPETYKEWSVPEILKSGNHGEIAKWRKEKV
jgi:tRNA (guanine37-N1)-methyltransferase